MKIETLEEFFNLVAEHGVALKVEVDDGRARVGVGYPKGIKPKVRDAMRDWAADNEAQVCLAAFALAKGWKPEGFKVAAIEGEAKNPFNPVTNIH